MTDSTLTPFSTRVAILSELWMDYRYDEEFKDFLEYNDLGLPLAYIVGAGLAEPTDMANSFIDETFEILIAGLGLEDTGFESLEHLLGSQA